MQYIFTSKERISEIKKHISEDARFRRELIELAESYMDTPALSVTYHKSPAASGDIHDYFSEGPYWWPNENDPDGPYIRRDGEFNPNVFLHHRQDLNRMSMAVSALAQAGLFLGDDKYFAKAAELMSVWFVNDETRMNPHLEYAQAIRGVCEGRGIGIIDTAMLAAVVNGANIIDVSGKYADIISGVKAWFREYLHWMTTSEKGLTEKAEPNNHSNWWNAQAAAFAALVGDDEQIDECICKFKHDILHEQMALDGSFPHELKRTRSYSYTIYNLTACVVICEVARVKGIDLWNFETDDGRSVRKAVEYFKPYYENVFLWGRQQIDVVASDNMESCLGEKLPMKLAALRYGDEELDKINELKRMNIIPCRETCHLGILDLI